MFILKGKVILFQNLMENPKIVGTHRENQIRCRYDAIIKTRHFR